MDGLGYEYAVTRYLLLVAHRVLHEQTTLVDRVLQSIHTLRCAFLCLQGTRSSVSARGKPSSIMHIGFLAHFHSISPEEIMVSSFSV